MLRKWLAAGYIEKGKLHPTTVGTPQGGLISATLLVITLRGLEPAIKAATKPKDKVNVCIYADDFVITGATKEVLENKVKPVVEAFLSERGLSLSPEKTKITHINEGFDFLGMNVRKYGDKLIIKPAKSSVKRFVTDIREIIKLNKTAKTENLIRLLNPKIRGWTNYYRHVCSKKTFNYIDYSIFKRIWRWSVRRHPNKNAGWVKKKYFRSNENCNWVFSTKIKKKSSELVNFDLMAANTVPIKRHIKIKAKATPFDASYHEYFDKRISMREDAKKPNRKPKWWLCWWNLLTPKKRTKVRVIQ